MKKTVKKTSKKIPRGRPTKYLPRYCKEIITFFNCEKFQRHIKSEKTITKSNGTKETYIEYLYMTNELPTINKFAMKIEVNEDTIVEWAKAKWPQNHDKKELQGQLKYPDFSAAYNRAKALQKEFLMDNAIKGLIPPASYIFTAKNVSDMRDKQEVDLTSKGKFIAGFKMIAPGVQATK